MFHVRGSAFRLCSAIDMIEDSWNRSDGIQRDIDREYEGIQAWIWVPNLYQLIEQSFKLLLRHKKQKSYRHHRLGTLYRHLDSEHRTILSDTYNGYRELYDYLPDDDLNSFLERADRGKGREAGYTTWRYMLLEGFPSKENETPTIHIGAMLEVSIAARDIMRREIIFNEKSNHIVPINLRIQESLVDEFNSIARRYCSRDEIQARVQNEPSLLASIHFERTKYCRDLLSRNLLWINGFVTSSPCLELNQENTKILEAICKRMMRDHKHDFLQYINRRESGDFELFEIHRY